MTLTNRVSAFFLGWLGLALIGFAAAVYLSARADLHRQIDDQERQTADRLQSTLDMLVAAAEIHRDGVEWEAHERTLPRGDIANGVIWLVQLPNGKIIDRSRPMRVDWLAVATDDSANDTAGSTWRVARRHLTPGAPQVQPPEHRVLVDEPASVIIYNSLDLVTAVPWTSIRNDLPRLAWLLTGLTASLWLTAAFVGRWLCRRTLRPVSEMAAAAANLSAADPAERLHVRPTGDELEGLGNAFNGALARLEEAFVRQARFTGDASHQLRTPLASMLGKVEVALRRERDEASYRDTLSSVADEIRHLNRLTEALLFLARADAEAGLPNLADMDLAEWMSTFLGEWQSAHKASRVELIVEGSAPRVRAHSELLGQLVDNLLDNAIKYGPVGKPIVVRVRQSDGAVELSVEDAGPGIAAEDLPHVFDPFFRSASARAAGVRGVGLGLSVARRIAEAIGACLTAESQLGQGSRFIVQFQTF
ncbi:MAG TPA: ATP-binding protein [Gemmataceae bacterium]|jgi:heavy metal sensor kinase|nr:ATP-binding protein [Gemmataceae bacterium]